MSRARGCWVAATTIITSHGEHHAHQHDAPRRIATAGGVYTLDVFEDGVPPRFRLAIEAGRLPLADTVSIETIRPDGTRHRFALAERDGYLESIDTIPEPHAFTAQVQIGGETHAVTFEEHAHGAAHRDNNMRAAIVHVLADAAVSVLVIAGLLLARAFGWLWMDPLAGIAGAGVIASWSYGLIRDTGAILLDVNPDHRMAQRLRLAIEAEGDRIADLHLWRLGPGHLGAIISIVTGRRQGAGYYHGRLAGFGLSHLTIEVQHDPPAGA